MPKVTLGKIAQERRETCSGDKSSYPVVGLEHLTPGEVRLSAWAEGGDNTFTKRFYKGDVLFGRRRAYLKKAAQAPFDGVCSGDITVIKPISGKVLSELLPFIIQNDSFFKYAIRNSAGSLSPRVKWSALENYEINLPSADEQGRLAELLWAAIDLKASYQRSLAASDDLVKSRFMEMFIAGAPYPREPLKNFITQIRGVSYKPEDLHPSLDDDSVLLLRANNIGDRLINHDEVQFVAKEKVAQNQLIQEGDILVCASSGSLEHVGKAALCSRSVAGETFGAFCKLIRPHGSLLPEYIASYLCTDEYRETIMQLACGSNINNLKTEHIDELQIPVPNDDEQMRFITCVHSLDKSKFCGP